MEKKHGGARKNAGAPKKQNKKETVVVRVDKSKVQLIRDINALDDNDVKKIYRSVYHNQGVRSVTNDHLLHEQIHQLEKDAREEIARLNAELEKLRQANSNSYEAKWMQLKKELYPALERLRQLVPDERW